MSVNKDSKYHSLSKEVYEQILGDREHGKINPYACKDSDIIRRQPDHDAPHLWRPAFVMDVEKILHNNYYNRYSDKTQVISCYKNDDISRRALHVQLVSRIARTIGMTLGLNLDLIEAISLGHDIGHTPFGHAGERVLNELCSGGFKHNKQSVRIVEKLEKGGQGLNLTWEVRDGILNHQTSTMPHTLEGKIVRFSDKIAYIHHDIDDAVRGKIMVEEDIPIDIRKVLGKNSADRLDTLIHDIITNSMDKPDIIMSDEIFQAMQDLRKFMFVSVYTNPIAKGEETKAEGLLSKLFTYYMEHPMTMPAQYTDMIAEGEEEERVVCDYIAGMTDQYAIAKFSEYFVPKAWQVN